MGLVSSDDSPKSLKALASLAQSARIMKSAGEHGLERRQCATNNWTFNKKNRNMYCKLHNFCEGPIFANFATGYIHCEKFITRTYHPKVTNAYASFRITKYSRNPLLQNSTYTQPPKIKLFIVCFLITAMTQPIRVLNAGSVFFKQ